MPVDPFALDVRAALGAAAAATLLGLAWQSPAAGGRLWARWGVAPTTPGGPARLLAQGFAACLAMALALSLLAAYVGIESALQGAWLGLLAWLGFAAPAGLLIQAGGTRALGPFLVSTGYNLVALVLIGAMVGGW